MTNANGNWNVVKGYIVNGASVGTSSGVAARYKFLLNKHYKTHYYSKSTGAAVTMDSCKSYQDL